MATQDISKFIPEKLQSRELYAKVQEMLQDLTDEQLELFNDVVLKYKDPYSIDKQGAIEVVEELGYGYITEIFEVLTEDELGTIVSYMGLIHLLKGSEVGLEVIFDLLKISYEMIAWHERDKDRRKGVELDSEILQTLEWKLVISLNDSPNLDNIFYTVPKIKEFSLNYVYPILAYIELILEITFDNIQVTGQGSTDEYDSGVVITPYIKMINARGSTDEIITDSVILPDADFSLYNDSILKEDDGFLYTEDGDILKL